tara:strand:+ start:395 stop:832 length:438 start_codon:yes stop_codon:yes gene_type:complete
MQERFTLQDAVRQNGQGSTWHQVDTIGSEPVELQAVATRPAAEEIDLEDLDDVELVDEDDYDFDLNELDAERLFWHQIGWGAFVIGSVFVFGVIIGVLVSANSVGVLQTLEALVNGFFLIWSTVIDIQYQILNAFYEAIKPIFEI